MYSKMYKVEVRGCVQRLEKPGDSKETLRELLKVIESSERSVQAEQGRRMGEEVCHGPTRVSK
jgi:hypothetical protein